jgi:hypothetical protein
VTTLVELTKSQAEAKQMCDQTIAQKQSEGFVLRSDWVAQERAQDPNVAELWISQHSSTGLQFTVEYEYNSHVASWLFITEAS